MSTHGETPDSPARPTDLVTAESLGHRALAVAAAIPKD